MKKRLLALLLSVLLLAGVMPAFAAADGLYRLGDTAEDFTVTSSDGSEYTLSALLESKKLVLLNFWATWCGPCRMEFPYMEEAYLQYRDEIEIIAINCDVDTAGIAEFKDEMGLSALPMAEDTPGLQKRFDLSAIPLSVLIDRFGVICWMEAGAITDVSTFAHLFDLFLGDNYTESRVGIDIYAKAPTMANPTNEQLSRALNADGGTLEFTNDPDTYCAWPFMPTDDGKLISGNTEDGETVASVLCTVDAKAGDVLAFDYELSSANFDALVLYVNGESAAGAWAESAGTLCYRFGSDGTYKLRFSFERSYGDGESYATLDNVRILSGAEADALMAAAPEYPSFLAGDSYNLSVYGAEPVVLYIAGDESNRLDDTFYIAQDYADSIELEIRIGEDCIPELALFAVNDDYRALSELEHDDEAYFYTVSDIGPEANIALLPDVRDGYDYINYVVFSDESRIEAIADEVSASYGIECDWAYLKDMPSPEATSGTAYYKISYVDQNGDAVAGVITQICTEELCNVLVSGENGVVEFEDAAYPYEVHVLKLPEGWSIGSGDSFVLDPAGGELVIELKKG